MALLKFLKGNYSSLSSAAIAEGQVLICGDTGEMFVDVAADKRVKIGDYVTVASLDALLAIDATSVPTSRLYYVEGANILARSNGVSWDQINKDTGATSIEVVGDGNAVTAASYDAITRKLTLTKGDTFVKQSDFDTLNQNVTKMGGKVYTVESESTDVSVLASGITAPKQGDVLIATNGLGVKSAYHYDAENGWIACDGKVDATTVILKDNITMAGNYTAIGNLTKTKDGQVFATAGRSVAEALADIFTKRLQPANPTQPAVTLTFSQADAVTGGKKGAYEVGTEVTPSYSASLSAGSYTYGPATGVTASEWTITDTNGHSAVHESAAASGEFAKFTVGDDTNYTITAKALHNEGAVAKDNLGDYSNPEKKIAAVDSYDSSNVKTKTSGAVTGYRSFFYGVLSTSSDNAPLTSAIVRGLTNGGAYDASKTLNINANSTAMRFVVAIPASSTRSGLTHADSIAGMTVDVTNSYIKTDNAVKVEGVNGATAVDYDVWVFEPSSIDAATKHVVTLG